MRTRGLGPRTGLSPRRKIRCWPIIASAKDKVWGYHRIGRPLRRKSGHNIALEENTAHANRKCIDHIPHVITSFTVYGICASQQPLLLADIVGKTLTSAPARPRPATSTHTDGRGLRQQQGFDLLRWMSGWGTWGHCRSLRASSSRKHCLIASSSRRVCAPCTARGSNGARASA